MTTPCAATVVADPSRQALNLQQYIDLAAGPYSSAGGYLSFEKLPASLRGNFSAHTNSVLAALAADEPEIEYVVFGFPSFIPGFLTIGAISAVILSPASRGTVTISSASVTSPPVIDLGWLSDTADQQLAVAAVRRMRQFWASSALDPVRAGAGEILPGAAAQSDADILNYVQNSAATEWHAIGTCAMGKSTDPNAVVDPNGKVYGVTGLRVVDASIFPLSIPGHPQATVYAIAEKIAAAILSGN
jgi:choline dehydrogenase